MHLNINDIREYTGAENDFIIKLFNKFLEHVNDDIAKLKSAAKAEDWDDVKRISHSMLSSARIFSLKENIVLHEKIEQDCINTTPAKIPEMVLKTEQLYLEVISEMRELKESLALPESQ